MIMSDAFTNQLSAYLDGELDDLSRARLEAHLPGCGECAAVLADLRAIVSAAPHYQGRQPGRDLWFEIESRLGESEVVPIGSAGLRAVRPSSRRFSLRQLIAASIVMAAIGGGSAWLALRHRIGEGVTLAATPAAGQPANPVEFTAPDVNSAAYADARYDAAVHDLEQVLQAGRGRLDSATVRTVEESLDRIDQAIAQARAAIQRDPANLYLSRQITANMRRKINLLRAATNAIAART
jgi:anti-sigma factor RsiW